MQLPARAVLAMIFTLLVALSGLSLSFAASETAPSFSPEAVISQRVSLYLEAAKKPINQLSSQIYRVATASERCRMTSGAKACGLPSQPLKTGSLDDVFKYYIEQPVEAALGRQKTSVSQSNWTWDSSAQHPAKK